MIILVKLNWYDMIWDCLIYVYIYVYIYVCVLCDPLNFHFLEFKSTYCIISQNNDFPKAGAEINHGNRYSCR